MSSFQRIRLFSHFFQRASERSSRPATNKASATLDFAGTPVLVQRKKVKYLRLKVHPHTGQVTVSAPIRTSDTQIHQFLSQHQEWLTGQLQKAQKWASTHPVSGSVVPLWGQQYPVTVKKDNSSSRLYFNETQGFVFFTHDQNKRTRQLEAFYRQQLQAAISQWQQHWPEKLAVQPAFYGIRKMHTKWGSCNVNKKRIWLALELAKYPRSSAEMVFVHELVHLLELHHTPRFYELMTSFMPDWQQREKALQHH